MPLFGSSKKGPYEMCKILVDSFAVLETADPKGKKAEKVFVVLLVFHFKIFFCNF